MTALLFGATGQVGREIVARAAGHGVALDSISRAEADFGTPAALRRAVVRRKPRLVVNAAAYTAVDRAEAEPGPAFAVNRDAPAALAAICAELDCPLIHISTDYVFDGAKDGAYREDDAIAPLNVYGASKAAGEAAIRAALPRHVILRTAWVFGPARDNFVKTMLRLGAARPELGVVTDQYGGPTAACDLADIILAIAVKIAAGQGVWGTFHCCGGPRVSRYDFASAIFAAAGRGPALRAATSAEFPAPARRPANSMLDCTRLQDAYGLSQPDWRAALPGIVTRILRGSS